MMKFGITLHSDRGLRIERAAAPAGPAPSASFRAVSLQSGFTMVEIALCLGIIAFALVAIIGVLPTGVKVQKENREETIINQDGLLFLEAIRGGAKGFEFLTNHVESIVMAPRRPNASGGVSYDLAAASVYVNPLFPGTASVDESAPPGAFGSLPGLPRQEGVITNSQQIIGLLTYPLWNISVATNNSGGPVNVFEARRVEARVRAISGVASEKGRQVGDFAFRYQARVEIEPFVRPPLQWLGNAAGVGPMPNATRSEVETSRALLNNLYEIRLTLRWPVYQQGDRWQVGRQRKTFRTLVSGEMIRIRPAGSPTQWHFLQPGSFTAITNMAGPRL